MRGIVLIVFLLTGFVASAQKQPLDHSVYDEWQSIGEKSISHDGRILVYTVNPQEGDGVLSIQDPVTGIKKEVPRGYHGTITDDHRYVIGLIKPRFRETREARIRKKKPEEMPKDSLFIFTLGQGPGWDNDSLIKIPRVKSYRTPDKGSGWLAWLSFPDTAHAINRKTATAPAAADSSTTLTLRNLFTGAERNYPAAREYVFSKKGNAFVVAFTKKPGDSSGIAAVLWLSLPDLRTDTVMRRFNEARSFTFDEEGSRLAFVAERDSAQKALRKFYNCWYYTPGMDSAKLLAARNSPGVAAGLTVSEYYAMRFSKSGHRLLIGLAPIRPIKDSTIPDFEKASLDIWNYKDDELQPAQLHNLDRDLKRSWLALVDIDQQRLVQLGDEKFPEIEVTGEGDGDWFYAASDYGKRVARQWQGYTLSDVYAINARNGEKKLIVRDLKGSLYPSTTGKYLLLYDERARGYSVYHAATGALTKAGTDIHVPLYDEENDVPDDPNGYGIAGWEKEDRHALIYDRYDIWSVDPEGKERSGILNMPSRRLRTVWRIVKTDTTEKYIDLGKPVYARLYNDSAKDSRYMRCSFPWPGSYDFLGHHFGTFSVAGLLKADGADAYIYTAENYSNSPDIYYVSRIMDSVKRAQDDSSRPQIPGWHTTIYPPTRITHLNPQQDNYLWGTAELFKWKAYTGRQTEGILYKPANFDPAKKYPMIVYFYERNNSTLYNYQAPAPTPSRLNIPFFVSRGYLVFVPDIWYSTGHPGKSAYDYIVSGTRALIRRGFVDSTKLGIQGQSWGGYQTAYVITRTNLFAAAWAGAPVVDMFSAYGGIRWESGLNRQMQYEKSQSRIGATIWERPDLYVENSPLFHLQQVRTPLVIMSNDADGAVPWYQGIEFFTAMRRLGKPVWLLQYNGEAHNLVERRNRKDIQVREQQYFDWLLKGAPAPKWITGGVPATLKGIDWGTELEPPKPATPEIK
ncbi:MAG: prolyl oligopeptidase family serine peptidase [Bacteroidota bacterium]|nr:prolyl oligopeptidase family serine peptidase [Bacteroidota bacterium]